MKNWTRIKTTTKTQCVSPTTLPQVPFSACPASAVARPHGCLSAHPYPPPLPIFGFLPSDLILHSSWKFLNAFNFCTVFGSSLGLPRFGIHDLEVALGATESRDEDDPREQREISVAPSYASSSNVSTPVPTGPSDGSSANAAFLSEFMSRLLQFITPNSVVLKMEKDKRQVT